MPENDDLSYEDDDAIDERLAQEGISPTKEMVHSILITFEPPHNTAEQEAYFDALVKTLGAELHDHACIIMNRYPHAFQIRVACVTFYLRRILRLLLRRDTTRSFALRNVEIEDTSPTSETGGESGE